MENKYITTVNKLTSFRWLLIIIIAGSLFSSCKKLVEINAPVNSITSSETFADSSDAVSAIAGIYYSMLNASGNISIGSSGTTLLSGLSSDEFLYFVSSPEYNQFYSNSLISNNSLVNTSLWKPAYSYIYQANACIKGLSDSKSLSVAARNEFIGEAKFLRAFNYFYLVNLFGDVPLLTTIDFKANSIAARTPKAQVYDQIIADLMEAQNLLASDYSYSTKEKVRANKWAATALLARVYLYVGKSASADSASSSVIGSSLYSLSPLTGANNVFSKNSSEAILQLQIDSIYLNATPEGYNILPRNNTSAPKFYINPQLLNAFEINDLRKNAWISSTTYLGTTYPYPNKYKVGSGQALVNGGTTEYYMMLRLAEQYLIRAEARAQQNNVTGAIADLNIIRQRAGLSSLPSSLTQTQVLAAIMQERRIELFAEWGHRWLDLKRTGMVDVVMSAATPAKGQATIWQSYQQLYPIPSSEMLYDPNLIQNSGY
ncbi:MAG: RagB/SusD family nutrient uptake outer membrane protein [Bacteroidota bacterium]